MMPAFRRRVAGKKGAPVDQPVTLNNRAVDGRRRPARQDGAVAEIDMTVDGRDIQQPALALGIDVGRAGDPCRRAIGKLDLPQRAAACRDKQAVGGQKFHAPGMCQFRSNPLGSSVGPLQLAACLVSLKWKGPRNTARPLPIVPMPIFNRVMTAVMTVAS